MGFCRSGQGHAGDFDPHSHALHMHSHAGSWVDPQQGSGVVGFCRGDQSHTNTHTQLAGLTCSRAAKRWGSAGVTSVTLGNLTSPHIHSHAGCWADLQQGSKAMGFCRGDQGHAGTLSSCTPCAPAAVHVHVR